MEAFQYITTTLKFMVLDGVRVHFQGEITKTIYLVRVAGISLQPQEMEEL